MPDFDHSQPDPRSDGAVPIAQALQALPLDAPPRSAWPLVAAAMSTAATSNASARPRRGAARWPYAVAAAAALALALLLPMPGGESGSAPVDAGGALAEASGTPAANATADLDLPALMQESARLERLIAAVDADPLQPADALVLGLAFEDQLAGLDAELAAAPRGSRDAARLWQQRVDVLSRYAELQSSRRLLASAGQPFETTLVALH